MGTCPICEKGVLKKSKKREIIYGVDLGVYPVELCSYCGETFTDGETMKKIEEATKKKEVWGIGKKLESDMTELKKFRGIVKDPHSIFLTKKEKEEVIEQFLKERGLKKFE